MKIRMAVMVFGLVTALVAEDGACASDLVTVPFSGTSMATEGKPKLRTAVLEWIRGEAVKKRCDQLEYVKAQSPLYLGLVMGMPKDQFDPTKVPRQEVEIWEVGYCGSQMEIAITFDIAAATTAFSAKLVK